MEIIIIALVALAVAAWYHTDDTYGTTSPAMVLGQMAKWITFGLLATADTTKVVVDATKNSNTKAKLAMKESGKAANLGVKAGTVDYKDSEVRKVLVEMSRELREDTKEIQAKLDSFDTPL